VKSKQVYENYIIFEDGRLFSVKRNRFLTPSKFCRCGRYRVFTMHINGIQKTAYAHRIVAEAFIPNPSNYPLVNHIDGNPSNNNVTNLEWCIQKYNSKHAYEIGSYYKNVCLVCSKEFYSKNEICHDCKIKARDKIITFDKKQRKIENYNSINDKSLTIRQQQVLFFLKQDFTFKKVGEILGISAQCVCAIQKLILKHERG